MVFRAALYGLQQCSRRLQISPAYGDAGQADLGKQIRWIECRSALKQRFDFIDVMAKRFLNLGDSADQNRIPGVAGGKPLGQP